MRALAFPLLFTLLLCSCNDSENSKEMKTDPTKSELQEQVSPADTKKTLKEELGERISASEAKGKSEKSEAYANGIKTVAESGILESALQMGDKAPDFVLTNALRGNVGLYEVLKKGPVILTWYRGGWCPYCNITLHYLQEEMPAFQAEGATLMALSPELPDKSISTQDKLDLKFEVLSDVGNVVAREYGVVFKLNDDVAEYYDQSFGMEEYNGDQSNELPLAATYVIDQEGIIRYAFLDADYRNRADPNDILKVLKSL